MYFRRPPINNQIRAREVRVIDETGKNLGFLTLVEALSLAQAKGLDLVQVTEKIDPPICKIVDYGKYLYREEKKWRKERKKTGGEVKGIRLGFNISLHDLETRVSQAAKFLQAGNNVHVELRLRGREKTLKNFAKQKIDKFLELLKDKAKFRIERELKIGSGGWTITLTKEK